MSAAINHQITFLWHRLQTADRGQRTELCKKAAQELGISLATVYRKLGEVGMKIDARKKRSDAGSSVLTREEQAE